MTFPYQKRKTFHLLRKKNNSTGSEKKGDGFIFLFIEMAV